MVGTGSGRIGGGLAGDRVQVAAAVPGRGVGRAGGPLESAALLAAATGSRPGGAGAGASPSAAGSASARRPEWAAALDLLPGAAPAPAAPPRLAGSPDRAADPPLRDEAVRRAGAHGRQEAGPHSGWRRSLRARTPRSACSFGGPWPGSRHAAFAFRR